MSCAKHATFALWAGASTEASPPTDRRIGIAPPPTEEALWSRAMTLVGCSVGELAQAHRLRLPAQPRQAKGHIGTLIEHALGASAGSQARADFPHLGIELKTVPVDAAGRPLESTFVSTVPQGDLSALTWAQSRVRAKLSRVLWVPVAGGRDVPLPERRIQRPQLWSPSSEQELTLRLDWEELIGSLALGGADSIQAHQGQCLQLRPKGQRGTDRRLYFDAVQGFDWGQPKAFYLRRNFTASCLDWGV
ncbi:MAG: DNA mismatch repair endonuclease MutH [Polyangiales bacterium]